ncbi:MAG: GGDEF domain-containing phosphodiesterase [Steroidobacteraceae bacterium]
MPSQHHESLSSALPDLIVLIRRDGIVLQLDGGQGVPRLRPAMLAAGHGCEQLWPDAVATLLRQLTRKAITQRGAAEATFRWEEVDYEVRVTPQGPDRALCALRAALPGTREDVLDATGISQAPQLDRRGFMRRFKESVALATLRERALALAVVEVEGLSDIAQAIAPKVSRQAMSAAVRRLPAGDIDTDSAQTPWYLGQINDELIGLVFDTGDRERIEAVLEQVCASLRQPVEVGSSRFHLAPHAGVALLGRDAATARLLVEHAHSAAAEARRAGRQQAAFFSDTLRLKSLARLDLGHELRAAIRDGSLRLQYRGRHELASGRLNAWVGRLRWEHPLRGEIAPTEFLRVAEATGLAAELTWRALECVQGDFARLSQPRDPGLRLSISPLRHHVLQESFADDIARWLAAGNLPPERLELRIAEQTFIARPGGGLERLARLGIQIVINRVARGMGSLEALARTPLWGLQLDRCWIGALGQDPVARRVCEAGIGMARALELTPIASGVDSEAQRSALLALGCVSGTGSVFGNPAVNRGESAHGSP